VRAACPARDSQDQVSGWDSRNSGLKSHKKDDEHAQGDDVFLIRTRRTVGSEFEDDIRRHSGKRAQLDDTISIVARI
jgi:hypothetical protein